MKYEEETVFELFVICYAGAIGCGLPEGQYRPHRPD